MVDNYERENKQKKRLVVPAFVVVFVGVVIVVFVTSFPESIDVVYKIRT